MSDFYRLCQVFDSAKQGDFIWLKSYRPSGKDGSLPMDWTRAMEEIPQDPPWPHCKVLRAPLFPAGYELVYNTFRLKTGTVIPDIFGTDERLLVSARAREVLETCDDFEHEYIETEVQDEHRRRINEQAYYLLNIRRFLWIEQENEKPDVINNLMFFANPSEKRYLPTLQNHPELMAKVAQVPLWRHRLNESVVYLKEQVLSTLREAGLTGLKEYSSSIGDPGETIARFEAQ